MQPRARPDAQTLGRLVELRLLLMEAQRRSRDATRIGRHSALVLLDGACEFALGLVADRLGVQRRRNAGVEEMHAAVAEALGDWQQACWTGVRALHRVRNLAQHVGHRGDRDDLPLWAVEAERYVRDLIAAGFGVDLYGVAVADAIEDAELRERFRLIETALANDENDAAAGKLQTLFADVSRRYLDTFANVNDLQARVASSFGGFRELEAASRILNRLQDYVALAQFASDPGELLWLRSLWRDCSYGVPVEHVDAVRAFDFVLNWTLRFESFSARYVSDRYARWHDALHPPTTQQGGPPRIIGVTSYAEPRGLVVEVQIADVPTDDLQPYIGALGRSLHDSCAALAQYRVPGSGLLADVNRAGVIKLGHFTAGVPASLIFDAVRDGLVAAGETLTQLADERESQRQAERAAIERCRASVDSAGVSEWVTTIEAHSRAAKVESVTVHVSGSMLPWMANQETRYRVSPDRLHLPIDMVDAAGEILRELLQQAREAAQARQAALAELRSDADRLQSDLRRGLVMGA